MNAIASLVKYHNTKKKSAGTGPEGTKCSGHCEGPCKSGQCLDQFCGKLISCSDKSKSTSRPSSTKNKECYTGVCASGCDSGVCVDEGCGDLKSCHSRDRKKSTKDNTSSTTRHRRQPQDTSMYPGGFCTRLENVYFGKNFYMT